MLVVLSYWLLTLSENPQNLNLTLTARLSTARCCLCSAAISTVAAAATASVRAALLVSTAGRTVCVA